MGVDTPTPPRLAGMPICELEARHVLAVTASVNAQTLEQRAEAVATVKAIQIEYQRRARLSGCTCGGDMPQ